jgi:N-acetyl sugar amidotransferase
MDISAAEIFFDAKGICNFCTEFLREKSNIIFEDLKKKEEKLKYFIKKVKEEGKKKKYDCIVGVSGGVDSSWTLAKVKELGLRPLAVHMDNGWNSELAQNNIANLVQNLQVDLYTHVINWNEYRELMQAFFEADVIDVELLYDNAMLAVNYQQANKYGVKYILSGSNSSTEGMRMPKEWNWMKFDRKNIIQIARRKGIRSLKTFPSISTIQHIYYFIVKRIKWIEFLDYTFYNKSLALNNLEKNFGFKRYQYKHYESVFTRFYQGYILTKKFKIDKRKLHLSTLVASGQISREEACSELDKLPYNSNIELDNDINYFLKKMKWTKSELDDYLSRPEISHYKYPTERFLNDFLRKIYKIFVAIKKIFNIKI